MPTVLFLAALAGMFWLGRTTAPRLPSREIEDRLDTISVQIAAAVNAAPPDARGSMVAIDHQRQINGLKAGRQVRTPRG